jgi:putative tryptophan/tyrosine transport system substrate-binding protein
MGCPMQRREFVTLLGSAAAAWPLAATAQQAAMPVIGFMFSGSSVGNGFFATAFRNGLKEAGYVEGSNLAIEYRWANGQVDRLPGFAADLVNRRVAAIFGDTQSALAAKAATAVIPIVFTSGGDPVKLGLVASLNRPGGNVTGASFLASTLAPKRLELLHEMKPTAAAIGYLLNPDYPGGRAEAADTEAAARVLGLKLDVIEARGSSDVEAAFATFVQHHVDAVIVGSSPIYLSLRDQIVTLAARNAIPAIYNLRPWTVSGGLMSYGPSVEDAARQSGVYVAKILKGTKPYDLPVIQSEKFEFVINLRTAKTLGLGVPQTLVVAADEVIE